jgi:hypothetical protein
MVDHFRDIAGLNAHSQSLQDGSCAFESILLNGNRNRQAIPKQFQASFGQFRANSANSRQNTANVQMRKYANA